MNRFKNILVIFNNKTDNRALFDQVVNFVQRSQAVLTVVDVIEEVPSSLAKQGVMELVGDVQRPITPIIEELPFDLQYHLRLNPGMKISQVKLA